MLELDSPRWQELSHAYGPAGDVTDLLKQAASLPPISNWKTEPYYSLWSMLCHQGDVYSASYAAVPHLLAICKSNPSSPNHNLLQLIVCIEMSRLLNQGPEIPKDLEDTYVEAVAGLTGLIADLHFNNPSERLAVIGAAAFAVNAKQAELAQAFMEMSSKVAPRFLEWFFES